MKKKSLYHLVKLNNKEKVVLVKCGDFYKSYLEDAIILSYLFDYKIHDNRVGFPKISLYKVINENNYKEYKVNTNKYIKILDKVNNIIELIENKLRNDINLYNLIFNCIKQL